MDYEGESERESSGDEEEVSERDTAAEAVQLEVPSEGIKERKTLAKVKSGKTGVCYLSRIPPHLKPLKLRHLLSQYGEVSRIYLLPEDPAASELGVTLARTLRRGENGWPWVVLHFREEMEESKKVYVHYEGKPEYTHVAKIAWGLTAQELAVDFTRVYNSKHGRLVSLDPEKIHLLNGRRRMSKSANLIRLVKDRSDIFVECERSSSAGPILPIEQNLSSEDEENTVKTQVVLPQETLAKAELTSGVETVVGADQEVVEPFICSVLEYALKAQQLKQYKLAGNTFSKVLEVLPSQLICLRGLGSMALAVKKYPEALPWLQRGVEEYPLDALFHARLGDAYSGLGKYQEALSEYDLALGLAVEQEPAEVLSDLTLDVDLEPRQNKPERHHHVPRLVDELHAGDILGALSRDGLKISAAAVLGKIGEGELASHILATILTQNAENFDALYQYGILILGRGRIKEAVNFFFKLLISRPGDKSVRSSLSKAIKHPQGLELLTKEVVVGPAAAPTLAFLAECLKDHGAIDEAAELYNLAISLSPSSMSYFLDLIHLYEVKYEYMKALGLAVSLFRSLPSISLNKLKFSDVLPYFEGPDWTESPDNISQQCQYEGLKFQAQAEFLRRFDELPTDQQGDGTAISSDSRNKCQQTKGQEVKCTYDDEDLAGLAILCSVTKILFFGGALERAKQLARLIEPARSASSKPLHQTVIRNEVAYFTSVQQILEQYPVPLPLPPLKEQRPVYLAGDSHCMSAAWRTVEVRGQKRLLVPLLVTGLKVWHLRPESEFYPKYAFENAMQSVADGAQLVMVFGEIDCRESILVSVEKGIYENVEEGIEVIVSIYLEVLQQLIFSRGFELFVHPVPPVLDPTRALVLAFNRILKQRLGGIKEKSPAGGRLHWLDFMPDLLTAEGFLKEEFKLDGTHLSPKYWHLLQRELWKVKGVVEA